MGSKPKKKPAASEALKGPSSVVLTGDLELVREYAQLCHAKGYGVVCHANAGDLGSSFPKGSGVIVSNRVPPAASIALELTNLDATIKRDNLRRLDEALEHDRLIISSSLTVSATEQSRWISRPYRLIGVGALPTFSHRPSVEVAPTVASPVESMEVARRFFLSLGMELAIVQDRVGMVFARILCQAVNEAAFTIQDGGTLPRDLDAAATLGAGFPRGPLEWAGEIGLPQIVAVLQAMHNDMQEERYRVCPLLKQLALGGQWWKQQSLVPEPTS